MILVASYIIQGIVNAKVLNKDYFNAKIADTGFYNQLSIEIEDGFENYVYQSGLPEDIIEGIYNEETLKNDVNSIISYIFGDDEIETSEELVKQNINNKIQTYLETNDIKLNAQGQANIESYEELISKEYRKKVVVSESLYTYARDIVSRISKVMNMVGNYPIIAGVVVILLLIIINKKNLLDAINYCGISLLSCGLLFRLADYFVNKNVKFDGLMIYSKSVTNLFVNIANEILNMLEDYSIFLIICGIVSILTTAILNSIEKKKNDSEENTENEPKMRFKPKQRKK